MLSVEHYLTALEQDGATVADVLRTGPLDAPVPACPGWDVRELAVHLGRTHRWATAALSSSEEPRFGVRPDVGADGDGLAGWFTDGVTRLVRALRDADPDRPCWSFALGPGTVGFWVRRQALETAVHRWDAQEALGRPAPIDAALAADGVDEIARMFYPRQVALGRREPLGRAVTLRPDDTVPVVIGEGEPVATVTGPAEPLLLALWRRRPASELVRDGVLDVDGDRDEALRVLAERLVP